jgi:succinate dehydrogenase / fumarate reductase cytochrome b subunit
MKSFFHSSIGQKIMVALTGLLMVGFLIGHLMGNLQVFLGAQKFNDYAAFLHHNPGLIWGARAVLLTTIGLHIFFTIRLTLHNKISRPVAYQQHTSMQASLSSRFMAVSGLFLAAYIVYHILHFTTGTAHPHFLEQDIYRNVIEGFSVRLSAWIYIVAMVCVGFHLHHGIWSVFQTLGLNHPKYNAWRRCLSTTAAIIIPAGYISIPVAVLLGALR